MERFLMKLFRVSLYFGVITMMSGLIGVPLGSYLAQRLRVNYPRADAYICACGLIGSAPVLFAASLYATHSAGLCYFLIFIGEVMLNMNWSIVADILLVSSTTLLIGFSFFRISTTFGMITILAGAVGVPLGGFLSRKLKVLSVRYDAVICSVGMFLTAAALFPLLLETDNWSYYVIFTLVFLAELCNNLKWAVVADILLVR